MNRTSVNLLHENAKCSSTCRFRRNLSRQTNRKRRILIERDISFKEYDLCKKIDEEDYEEDITPKNTYSNNWNKKNITSCY